MRDPLTNCTILGPLLPGMPWEDAEEKKKNQGNNNAWLAYILQVYLPDYDPISNLCRMAKQCKL